MTDAILPGGWKKPAGFSEGCRGAGTVVAVAGQLGLTHGDGSANDRTDFPGQWATALKRVVEVVGAAGGSAQSIVALRVYVTSIATYVQSARELGPAWKDLFGQHYPAITLIEVSALMAPEALLEIEATAVVDVDSR